MPNRIFVLFLFLLGSFGFAAAQAPVSTVQSTSADLHSQPTLQAVVDLPEGPDTRQQTAAEIKGALPPATNAKAMAKVPQQANFKKSAAQLPQHSNASDE